MLPWGWPSAVGWALGTYRGRVLTPAASLTLWSLVLPVLHQFPQQSDEWIQESFLAPLSFRAVISSSLSKAEKLSCALFWK